MNELLFFIHVILVMGFALGALRLGKEALIAWVAIQAVLANLFVIKQMNFFGFEVTCSDVFAVGSILGLNLLQEYWGKESAKKAAWICFLSMVFFGIMSQIHLLYRPSIHDTTHPSFQAILSTAPRILIASLSVFALVQQIDLRVFSLLRERMKNASFLPRNLIALLLSQFLDTTLFSFAGLYGIVASLFDIVLISFLIKVAVILCSTPFIAFASKFARRREIA
jgi:uncharacterized integral membrane protein (TIGR00697 family)